MVYWRRNNQKIALLNPQGHFKVTKPFPVRAKSSTSSTLPSFPPKSVASVDENNLRKVRNAKLPIWEQLSGKIALIFHNTSPPLAYFSVQIITSLSNFFGIMVPPHRPIKHYCLPATQRVNTQQSCAAVYPKCDYSFYAINTFCQFIQLKLNLSGVSLPIDLYFLFHFLFPWKLASITSCNPIYTYVLFANIYGQQKDPCDPSQTLRQN